MKIWPLHLRIIMMSLPLLLALTSALAWAAPIPLLSQVAAAFEPSRTGFDPLSPTERELALQLAQQDSRLSRFQRAETLLVERHQEAKSTTQSGQWSRRADVYVYDYEADKLIQATINLATRQVDHLETAQNIQLPLTESEIGQALQLAVTDPGVAAVIQSQFQTLTGQTLADPLRQLNVHALIFRADAQPDQKLGRAAACGRHRCAQLLLSTHTDLLINISPVVDLSQGQLVSANRFVEP